MDTQMDTCATAQVNEDSQCSSQRIPSGHKNVAAPVNR